MVLRRFAKGLGLFLVGVVLALVFVWAIGGPVDASGTEDHPQLRRRIATLEEKLYWLEKRAEKLSYNGSYRGDIIFRQVLTPVDCDEGEAVVWLDKGIGC